MLVNYGKEGFRFTDVKLGDCGGTGFEIYQRIAFLLVRPYSGVLKRGLG